MDFTCKSEDGKLLLKFGGDLSVKELPDAKSQIISNMDGCSDIVIDASDVEDCDTAGIQFVYCLSEFAKSSQKGFFMAGPSKSLQEAAERACMSLEKVINQTEVCSNG